MPVGWFLTLIAKWRSIFENICNRKIKWVLRAGLCYMFASIKQLSLKSKIFGMITM